jgi:hypothetical protein
MVLRCVHKEASLLALKHLQCLSYKPDAIVMHKLARRAVFEVPRIHTVVYHESWLVTSHMLFVPLGSSHLILELFRQGALYYAVACFPLFLCCEH